MFALIWNILNQALGIKSNMLFPDKNALLQFEWDCMNLSFYNPDEEMRELLEQIARSEGMFLERHHSNKEPRPVLNFGATAVALNFTPSQEQRKLLGLTQEQVADYLGVSRICGLRRKS